MKVANAIQGGLAGATTISLLGETLRKMDGGNEYLNVFDSKRLQKRFKKAGSNKKGKNTKQFVQLAGDLLGSTTFLGLTSLGKRKNAVLRGALLGAAAGLGSVLLNEQDSKREANHSDGEEGFPYTVLPKDPVLQKAVEVGLFTVGGMIAAKLIQKASTKKKQKK